MNRASPSPSSARAPADHHAGIILPATWRQLRQLPARRIARAATLLAAALATPAAAQQLPAAPEAAPYARAIAAGYKAAMLCAGIFNAGRTERQIDADELTGIYPDYQAIVSALTAKVDREARSVEVAFDPSLPPRSAHWTRDRGCTLLPIGGQGASVMDEAPGGEPARPAGPRPASRQRWPQGDAGIAPRPPAALSARVATAFDAASYGAGSKTTGIVVLHDGKVIAERYAAGWGPFVSNRTWSVGKSIAGTLVGLSGMNPAAPAAVPEWHNPATDDPRAAITLDQLLRMGSGLHSATAGNRTDAIYFGGTAVTEEAVAWPLEAVPGTRFRYANNDILLAIRSLRATVGEDRYAGFAQDRLFAPLGMAHTVAERDWRGNYILSSQVWSTARDLARLGQLWLQDGVWQGQRLLPEGWMRYMTTPSGPQPASGPGYGATLWLFGPAQGLPTGSYAAQGNRGQYVMVVPSRQLVVVRRGEDPGPARFDIARFTADVAAAIR